jgi:hypothetical protein
VPTEILLHQDEARPWAAWWPMEGEPCLWVQMDRQLTLDQHWKWWRLGVALENCLLVPLGVSVDLGGLGPPLSSPLPKWSRSQRQATQIRGSSVDFFNRLLAVDKCQA